MSKVKVSIFHCITPGGNVFMNRIIPIIAGILLIFMGYSTKSYGSIFVGVWILVSDVIFSMIGIRDMKGWKKIYQVLFLVGYFTIAYLLYKMGSNISPR